VKVVLELDHMFVAVRRNAPEMATLTQAGFKAAERRSHRGQGTASAGVFFENAYVELLWLENLAEAESTPIRRTRLAQRADPEQDGLPFGFGLRLATGSDSQIPFGTWEFRPPYLPAGTAIPTGNNSDRLTEPLLFILPWKSGPGYECPTHSNGARRVSKVSLTIGRLYAPSAAFKAFCALGLVDVRFAEGAIPLLEVELDDSKARESLDMRPAVPLVVRW
jgi:hypothetical protein